jgi:DUF1365 family protein
VTAPSTAPALYRAVVTHTRAAPVRHRFRHSTYYWLIDVDSPPRPRWPIRLLARFDPSDHDDPRVALAEAGLSATRIVRLAHARSFGHGFNPLSVCWCYRDETLVAVIAEVHNTYGGRHSYLLQPDPGGRARVDKALYVSPFNPVEGHYDIRVSPPTADVFVSVTYRRDGGRPFTATLSGRRAEVSTPGLLGLWLRHPATPLRTSMLIRWHGVRLWAKGLKVQPR